MAKKTEKKKPVNKKISSKTKKKSNTSISKKGKKQPDKGTEKMTLKNRILVGFGIVAVFYICSSLYFSSHFFPRTEINGYSCQFQTVQQVKAMLAKSCEEYELVLEKREDQQEKITSSQVGLQFVDDEKIEDIKEMQKGFAWMCSLFEKPVYENGVTIVFDEEEFNQTMDSLECLKKENTKSPEAAYPFYNEEKGSFEIAAEVLGTQIDKIVLTEQIKDAILSNQSILNLDESDCYVKPAFYSSDTAVVEAQNLMNHYITTEIIHDFGYTKVAVEKNEIAKWLKADQESNVIVDADKVGDYVEWLGNHYNTCGIRRTFKTPENKIVTVSGGTYGWRIHYKNEVEQLCKDVLTGEKIEREPIYRQTGYQRDSKGNDLHDTYIAISIQSQTMWYYKDGKCMLTTPVVTGNTSKKMGTPTGVYEIAYKKKGHVLRGEDYESPVDYWMPFYEYRGIGIHDASWRAADAFGKEIYKTNGSHGCVNTPYDAVKTLFEIVKAGTPVVVY